MLLQDTSACCQTLAINHCQPTLVLSGISEADSDIRDLLHAPSGSGVAADNKMMGSSDEDTSDEAFAGRHAALEAEEQQRFNTLAGRSRACPLAVNAVTKKYTVSLLC